MGLPHAGRLTSFRCGGGRCVAKLIQDEGGTPILTSFGRAMGATERANGRLPKPATILELDVTNEENLANLASEIKKHTPTIDGVVHAIGFAPQSALGGNFLSTEWPDVATAHGKTRFCLVYVNPQTNKVQPGFYVATALLKSAPKPKAPATPP